MESKEQKIHIEKLKNISNKKVNTSNHPEYSPFIIVKDKKKVIMDSKFAKNTPSFFEEISKLLSEYINFKIELVEEGDSSLPSHMTIKKKRPMK